MLESRAFVNLCSFWFGAANEESAPCICGHSEVPSNTNSCASATGVGGSAVYGKATILLGGGLLASIHSR
jgi:hypothetical protein